MNPFGLFVRDANSSNPYVRIRQFIQQFLKGTPESALPPPFHGEGPLAAQRLKPQGLKPRNPAEGSATGAEVPALLSSRIYDSRFPAKNRVAPRLVSRFSPFHSRV